MRFCAGGSEQLQVDNVIKKFGSEIALNNVSVEFERGKTYGIVGRNGSGKTVLFKTINMVIIIESPGFLSSYSGYKNLEYLASIKNIIGKNTREHGTSWT